MKICVSRSRRERASSSLILLLAFFRFARQVAAEREALAFQSGGHQRQHDRRRPDQRHDADAFALRGFHQRGAGIRDRRAAGLGEQADGMAFLKLPYMRRDIGFENRDVEFLDRARHSDVLQECTRRLGVLDHEVAQRS